jgi:cell wall-associated NlpC family hydrolase
MPPRFSSRILALVLAAFVFGCTIGNAAARPDPDRVRPEPKPTLGQRAARIAVKAVGIPYRWGGSSPSTGFDCSGLVSWAYGRLGIALPHSSYALYDQGRRVSPARLKAGDLLFFSGLGHVGLYVGRGQMVHAPHSGALVEVVRLGSSGYGGRLVGARRIVRG